MRSSSDPTNFVSFFKPFRVCRRSSFGNPALHSTFRTVGCSTKKNCWDSQQGITVPFVGFKVLNLSILSSLRGSRQYAQDRGSSRSLCKRLLTYLEFHQLRLPTNFFNSLRNSGHRTLCRVKTPPLNNNHSGTKKNFILFF